MFCLLFVQLTLLAHLNLQVLAGPICPETTELQSEVVGGRIISQRLQVSNTMSGCQWTLEGRSFTEYVYSKSNANKYSCWSCKISGNHDSGSVGMKCSVPKHEVLRLVHEGKCRYYRAIDCQEYLVDYFDTSKPCRYESKPDPCSAQPITMKEMVSGKSITQNLIYLQVSTGVCQWVLMGSNPEKYILSKDHSSSCSKCQLIDGKNNCSDPVLSDHQNPECSNVLAVNCQVYEVNNSDKKSVCPKMLETRLSDTGISSDVESYSAYKELDNKKSSCLSCNTILVLLIASICSMTYSTIL